MQVEQLEIIRRDQELRLKHKVKPYLYEAPHETEMRDQLWRHYKRNFLKAVEYQIDVIKAERAVKEKHEISKGRKNDK